MKAKVLAALTGMTLFGHVAVTSCGGSGSDDGPGAGAGTTTTTSSTGGGSASGGAGGAAGHGGAVDACGHCAAVLVHPTLDVISELCTNDGPPTSKALFESARACACGTCNADCGANVCLGQPLLEACTLCLFANCAAEVNACGADAGNQLLEGTFTGDCADAIDNDGDGATDCADPDCAAKICRGASDACDAIETCAAGVCPADAALGAGVMCRAAVGGCDAPELCDGSAPACPDDSAIAAGTECRAVAGPCDVAEACDGYSSDCPEDAFTPAGALCRPSTDLCDAPEACTGTDAACPSDALAQAGSPCRPASDVCDAVETCTGGAATCPGNALVAAGIVCRTIANGCNALAEACTGASAACPPDLSCALKANGAGCASGNECLSGHCTDGVCCDEVCGGGCQACNLPNNVGTCRPRAANTDPENACGYYTCNGAGACATTCANDAACHSDGYCVGTPYGTFCVGDRQNGASCARTAQCTSGFCVDGVCCNSACNGDCRGCKSALPKPAGTCGNYLAHTDPDNDCGRNTCDGSGACYTGCSGVCSSQCKNAYWCAFGQCAQDLPFPTPCLAGCQCQSHSCGYPLWGCLP